MRRRSSRALLFSIFCLHTLSFARESEGYHSLGPQPELTPQSAIKQAYVSRSSLEANEYSAWTHRIEERIALSDLLPHIKMENFFMTGTPGTFGKHEAEIVVTQRIIDLGGPLYQHSIARQKTHIAELEGLLQEDSVRHEVELGMLEVWRLQRKQDFVKAAAEAADQKLLLETHRGAVGELDIPALADVQARHKRIMAEVANYLSEARQSRIDLRSALERKTDQKLDPQAMESFVASSLEQATTASLPYYLDQALCSRKEIFIKDEEIHEQEYQEVLFARAYWPRLSFWARLNRSGIAGLFQEPIATVSGTGLGIDPPDTIVRTIWRVGARLDWEFDGFEAMHEVKATEFRTHRLLAERRDVLRQVRQEVEEGYETMQRKMNDLEASQDRLVAAEKSYNKQRVERQVGLITQTVFAKAQSDFEEAKFNEEETRIKVANAQRELAVRSGYLECVG